MMLPIHVAVAVLTTYYDYPNLVSGQPPFLLLCVYTVLHRNGRVVKNKEGMVSFIM